jgi:hypothetical protein
MSGIRWLDKKDLILKGINEGTYPESVYKFRTIDKASDILQKKNFTFHQRKILMIHLIVCWMRKKNTLYQTLIVGYIYIRMD